MIKNEIKLEHVLAMAEAFESDELSFEDTITFFKALAVFGREYLDMLPLYYCDIIDLLIIRGDLDIGAIDFEEGQESNVHERLHANPKDIVFNFGSKPRSIYRFPNLMRAIGMEQNAHSILTSPFVYSGNKADIILQLFPRFDFQPTFVDMFGGSGVVSINIVKGEKFIENGNRDVTNQKVYMFEYTSAMANVHSTMKMIHPEICFYLVKKIIDTYQLDVGILSDKAYNALTPNAQATYRAMRNQKLQALASDFYNYEIETQNNSNQHLSIIDRAYYNLMYFVMYRYRKTNSDIRQRAGGGYSIYAGGDGFRSSQKCSFLVVAYRFFKATYQSFKKDCPTYELQNSYMSKNRIGRDLDTSINRYPTTRLYKKGPQSLKDAFAKKRENLSMLDKTYIPSIEVINDSSIGQASKIQQLLKPFRDEKDRKLFYADPPYLASEISYGGGWGKSNETELLETLDTIHENGHLFALSNVTDNAGKSNYLLKAWLFKNKHIYVSILEKDYKAAQAKESRKYITIEILATNYPHAGGLPFHKLTEQIKLAFEAEMLAYDHDGSSRNLAYTEKTNFGSK
jgi:hypothetical protein